MREMKKTCILILLIVGIYSNNCLAQQSTAMEATNEESAVKPLNPNGDSELALLMRSMYDDGMAMKLAIKNGDAPKSHIDISELYTSEPTVTGKSDTPEYKAFALAYEAAFKDLGEANEDQKTQAYRTLVNSCITCHKTVCPGPIVRIEKMKL